MNSMNETWFNTPDGKPFNNRDFRELDEKSLHFFYTSDKKDLSVKGSCGMSIAGITICQDGFIAIADSKSTVYTRLKTPTEDEFFRPQKIFDSNKFLLVTYGVNWIWERNNNGKARLAKLEKWIDQELTCHDNYLELLWNLQKTLQLCDENVSDNTYYFIIGSVDDAGPFVQYASVNREHCIVNAKQRVEKAYWGGNDYYCEYLSLPSVFISDLCERTEIILKSHLEDAIRQADQLDSYNPAGLPVQTKIALFEG